MVDTPDDEDFSDENARIDAQLKRFARRLRFERQKLQFSQTDLALNAGLSQNLVSYIETGKISPSITTVFKICNILGISPSVLFDTSDIDRSRAKEAVLDLVSRFM